MKLFTGALVRSSVEPYVESKQTRRVRERVSRIPTHQLLEWAERALYDVGRGLSEHQKHLGTDDLAYAAEQAEALHWVLQEALSRVDT